MKIVYIWMLDAQRNQELSFNLGSDNTYEFNRKLNKIIVNKNPNYISDFFKTSNTIQKVSVDFAAIIGENGTGKTKALEMLHIAIAKIMRSGLIVEPFENSYLIIIEKDNKDKEIYFSEDLKTISWNDDVKIINGNRPTLSSFFISNVFDAKILFRDRNYSTNNLLYEVYVESHRGKLFENHTYDPINSITDLFLEYKFKELLYQIQLLSVVSDNRTFKFPQIMKFRKKEESDIYHSILAFMRHENKDGTVTLSLDSNFEVPVSTNGIERFFNENRAYNQIISDCYIFILILAKVLIDKDLNLFEREEFELFKLKKLEEENTIHDIFDSLLNWMQSMINKHEDKDISNLLISNIKIIKNTIDSTLLLGKRITTNEIDIKEIQLNSENLDLLHDAFFLEISMYRLTWKGYSSGEIAILNTLSRIYRCITENHSKHLVILIDEADLYFHPQLQRRFINIVLDFIETLTNSKQFLLSGIQFILTTHSPFLISDLTPDRILFMHINESGETISNSNLEDLPQTFGANIHDLYAHSFFLKGGAMGEFAKNKINDLANRLIKYVPGSESIDFDEILREINLVGEPILRKRLFKLYDEKKHIPEQNIIRENISQLKEQIKKLEQRLEK